MHSEGWFLLPSQQYPETEVRLQLIGQLLCSFRCSRRESRAHKKESSVLCLLLRAARLQSSADMNQNRCSSFLPGSVPPCSGCRSSDFSSRSFRLQLWKCLNFHCSFPQSLVSFGLLPACVGAVAANRQGLTESWCCSDS